MTGDDTLCAARIAALQDVSFQLGARHKSFARSVKDKAPAELSPAQYAHVARLCWRYRRQLPAHLVPPADPDAGQRAPLRAAAPMVVVSNPPPPDDLFTLMGTRK